MIVIDSSAVVAFLLEEPEVERIEMAVSRATRVLLPAPAHVESSIVMASKLAERGLAALDRFVAARGIEVVPFTATHARLAREAFLAFGKGRHPAGLNFGDCMSYAVAKAEGLPLLFVGDDFGRTDLAPA